MPPAAGERLSYELKDNAGIMVPIMPDRHLAGSRLDLPAASRDGRPRELTIARAAGRDSCISLSPDAPALRQ